MAHPYFHARSATRQFGGVWQDYITLETWFDRSKAFVADCRHRLVLHNEFGIRLAEQVFGAVLTRASDGQAVATRALAEAHIKEDFGGRIPTVAECRPVLPDLPWMKRPPCPLAQQCRHSARRFGGQADDYRRLHDWLDQDSGEPDGGAEPLLVLHTSYGIFLAEEVLGATFTRASDSKVFPVRPVLEEHIRLDFAGRIPSLDAVLQATRVAPWMCRAARKLSNELGLESALTNSSPVPDAD